MAKTANKTASGALGTIHKTVASLHRAGVIDKANMREFDELCRTPTQPDQAERKVSRRAK
jgi:putative transcriptional regulator